MKLKKCCNRPRVIDLTHGQGESRHYYCQNCGAHYWKDKRWTAQEWFETYEKE